MPAELDKLLFVNPVIVLLSATIVLLVSVSVEVSERTPTRILLDAEFIVLFVNVSVASLPTTVSVLSGNVSACKSVYLGIYYTTR